MRYILGAISIQVWGSSLPCCSRHRSMCAAKVATKTTLKMAADRNPNENGSDSAPRDHGCSSAFVSPVRRMSLPYSSQYPRKCPVLETFRDFERFAVCTCEEKKWVLFKLGAKRREQVRPAGQVRLPLFSIFVEISSKRCFCGWSHFGFSGWKRGSDVSDPSESDAGRRCV